MNTAVNFVSSHLVWWILGALIFGFLMVIMGIKWENSGKTETLRKKWMIVMSKVFGCVFGIMGFIAVLSIMIRFWRAVFTG